jgi:hypothetical protein
MSENSKIEWTHHTFNPWWGCAKVSPGCDHCYAEALGNRFGTPWGVDAPRRVFTEAHWRDPLKWNAKAAAAGERQRVFCASMADVFDKNSPPGARDRVWSLIRRTPHLDWLLLTKRIGNAVRMLPPDWGDGYPNAWLGISVVNQEEAVRDIPKLLQVPAAIRLQQIRRDDRLGRRHSHGAVRVARRARIVPGQLQRLRDRMAQGKPVDDAQIADQGPMGSQGARDRFSRGLLHPARLRQRTWRTPAARARLPQDLGTSQSAT